MDNVYVAERIVLDDGRVALKFSGYVSLAQELEIKRWIEDVNLTEHIDFLIYYESDMFGDINYYCLAVSKNAPEHVLTFCELAWSARG